MKCKTRENISALEKWGGVLSSVSFRFIFVFALFEFSRTRLFRILEQATTYTAVIFVARTASLLASAKRRVLAGV